MQAETIFALSSGAVRSAVAVIRVSGAAVPQVLATFLDKPVKPREAALRGIRDPRDGSVLDRGIVLHFPGPHSFTGEDVVEFQVHGSLAVVRLLLGRLGDLAGLRAAQPGEFTLRAWLNGRMDLLEVEALSDMLAAETEIQRKLAVDGSRRLRERAARWRSDLLGLRALMEAQIDFADEGDVQDRLDSDTEQKILDLAAEFRAAAASLRSGQRLRTGFRVAILGAPNAGKSSLMNALADRDVAITSPVPGTTRDVVESVIDLHGLPVILMDTVGLRSGSSDEIEVEGMRRSRLAADGADLVIWASAIDSPMKSPNPAYFEVVTKGDLAATGWPPGVVVSSLTGAGLDSLAKEIHVRAGLSSGQNGLEDMLQHQRHADCLLHAANSLCAALAQSGTTVDVRAEELRLACDALDRLTGRISPEEVLGEIFSRFCIGK